MLLESAAAPVHAVRSTWFDRLLIFLLVFSIYFEANLPYLGRASTPFMLFAFTLGYLSFYRGRSLLRQLSSRYFIVSLLFALTCLFMENLHPDPSVDFISRFVNMTIGIFCIAVLCRDLVAFDIALFTFVMASAMQSVILITGTFQVLHQFSAEGFYDASRVRLQAFEEFYLRGNLNDISYFSSIGAIIGIIWSYFEREPWRKILLLSLTLPSIVGVFLPASRTGAVIFFASMLIFLWRSGFSFRRWVFPILTLLLFLVLVIPEVVWVRLGSLMRFSELQEQDSRTRVYGAVLRSFDQYFLTGVGSGHYWDGWAVATGITDRFSPQVAAAAHNAFFQVWIYWGLPALVLFLLLIREYARAVDPRINGDRRKACIFIFSLMIPMIFLFYHSFYHKSFSIGLGMLLGTRLWNLFDEKKEEPIV
jgi:O-antigen ligase